MNTVEKLGGEAALEQPDAKPLLEKGHPLAQRGLGYACCPRRGGEALMRGHSMEEGKVVQVLHGAAILSRVDWPG